MQIIDKKLTDLKPYANNPRHNAKAVPAVKESILKFGFKVPIVIDKNNIIVCGHTRFYASKEIGLETVPCIVADDLTDEQINAFRLVDNRVSEFADWNFDKLAEELSDLQDFDFEPFAFDDLMAGLELDYNLNQKDEETIEDDYDAEPPVETNIKYGDVYQLGSHRLMCGDSTKEEAVEKLMNGEKADLFLTDPPYNVDYSAKNTLLNKFDNGKRIQKNIENDKKNSNEFYEFLVTAFKNAYNVLKNGACFYVFYPNAEYTNFHNALNNSLLNVHQYLVWCKNNHVLGMNDYQYKHEPIFYGWKEGKHSWFSNRSQTTVLNFDRPLKNDLHPTMKPISLLSYLIQNNTNYEFKNVLDLFGGSGSTLMACEQLNRKCYMMELDEHYVQVIIDRWEKFTGKKAEKING